MLGGLEVREAASDGFVQREQREAGGGELIAERIAVLLNERGFGGAVRFIRCRHRKVSAWRVPETLGDRAAWLLRLEQITRNDRDPPPMRRRILHAHEPREAQQHPRPLDVVHPPPLLL